MTDGTKLGLRALPEDLARSGLRTDSVQALLGSLPRILSARCLAVILFRLSFALGSWIGPAGVALKQLNQFVTGADIAWQARIGPGLILYHPNGVVIGPGVKVGGRAGIQQGVTIGGSGAVIDGSPTLGDDVLVGAGGRILGPVIVGSNCIVGANAVLLVSIPDGTTAVGVPARVTSTPRQATSSS